MSYITKFDTRLNQISSEIWSKIAKIEELNGRWIQGTNLSPQYLNRLKRSVLITSTGASTRIEGSTLSDSEVEQVMKGLIIQKFSDRDSEEVRGYFELLENIFSSWEDLSLTEGTVKHFHKELLKYSTKDTLHRGNYKSKENQVRLVDARGRDMGVLFDTTQSYLTPKEMNELVEWTRTAITKQRFHPLLIIGNFIVEFLNIHPFEDGNGRLSRILTNLLLLKSNYLYIPYVSHEKLIEERKADYYLALRNSQKTFKTNAENLTPWLNFFLDVTLSQSQTAIHLITEENIEALLSPKQLTVWNYLQNVDEVTPRDIAKDLNIPRITISQILNKLLKLKKIARLGTGPATRYKKL